MTRQITGKHPTAANAGRVVDERGRGVGGVAVSNGETVVLSQRDGSFTLDRVDPSRHPFVFLTTPAGWRAAGNAFFRAADTWHAGDRTFALQRDPGRSRCAELTVVTDLHLHEASVANVRRLSSDLRAALALKPRSSFVLADGDLTDRGFLPSLRAVDRCFQAAPRPVIPVFGGHDGREEAKDLKLDVPWARHYMQVFGPLWYSFDWGKWHFAIYANEDHHFPSEMNAAKHRWLMRDLSMARRRKRRTIVALHAPPTLALSRELSRHGVSLAICGHWHTLKSWTVGRTTFTCSPPTVFGGIDMMPRGARIVDLRGANPQVQYRPLAIAKPTAPPRGGAKVIWSCELDGYAHREGMTADGDDLFVVANRDDRGHGAIVRCISAAEGRVRWVRQLAHAVKHAPVVRGSRVLLVTQPGELVCIDRSGGAVRWSRRLQEFPNRWIHAPPCIVDNVIVAGTFRGGLEGFSIHNGRRLWSRQPIPGKPTASGDIWPWSAAMIALDDDDAALVPAYRIGLARLSARTGQLRWTAEFPYHYFLPGPLLRAGGIIVCPPADIDQPYLQIDARTGTVCQRSKSARIPIGWTCSNDDLFVAATDAPVDGRAFLECRDARDGRLKWETNCGRCAIGALHYSRKGPNVLAGPVVHDAQVLQPCLDGTLRIFDARNGRLQRKLDMGSPLFASPIVAGERFWITTWHGRLICAHL